MRFSTPVNVGDTVIERATGEELTITAISFKDGYFDDEKIYYHNAVAIHTTKGIFAVHELQEVIHGSNRNKV